MTIIRYICDIDKEKMDGNAIMKPLYTKISDYVMEKIQNEEWPVGYMLPPEVELCQQFGVSRTSVRTALLTLVNDGYLHRVKGKGTFVTTPQRVEESTIFIESFAEEMRKRGKAIETEVLEFRMMRAEPRVCQSLRLPEGSNVIKLTRLRYSKGRVEEGPIVLTTSYYTMKLAYLQNYDFSSTSVHKAMVEHGMAKKFTEKHISVAVLDPRSSRLMAVESGSLALTITSFTEDMEDELVEFCESYYPASRNEFILKIRL